MRGTKQGHFRDDSIGGRVTEGGPRLQVDEAGFGRINGQVLDLQPAPRQALRCLFRFGREQPLALSALAACMRRPLREDGEEDSGAPPSYVNLRRSGIGNHDFAEQAVKRIFSALRKLLLEPKDYVKTFGAGSGEPRHYQLFPAGDAPRGMQSRTLVAAVRTDPSLAPARDPARHERIRVEANPIAIAVDSTRHRIYVVNHWGNSVSVIQGTERPRVTHTIPGVGEFPFGIAFDAERDSLYVADRSGCLRVIHLKTGRVGSPLIIGGSLRYLALDSATNRLLVTDFKRSLLWAVDREKELLLGSVAMEARPYGVALNDRTGRAYVTNDHSSKLTVLREARRNEVPLELVDTIQLNVRPFLLAVDKSSNRIFVTHDLRAHDARDIVSTIDGETNRVVHTASVHSRGYGLAVDPERGLVYVAHHFVGGVTAIESSTGKAVFTLPAGAGPTGVAVDADSGRVYVANYLDSTVSVLTPGSEPPTEHTRGTESV